MAAPWDVIVVGGGNAGFCAAQSARQAGARVLVLEKAPRQWAGGNSYFTAGAMRTSHGGLADLENPSRNRPRGTASRSPTSPRTPTTTSSTTWSG
ncbi:FAD-dependent oxidoreductase [Streptomyces sp. NPDC056669]|uniref:FAD-dependent oxidoreductase n=1 Tax=Streptomyces sp. NPDC056669 TaxID=3345903 RepID=UPI003697201F